MRFLDCDLVFLDFVLVCPYRDWGARVWNWVSGFGVGCLSWELNVLVGSWISELGVGCVSWELGVWVGSRVSGLGVGCLK